MPGRMPIIGRAIALAVLLACAPVVALAQTIIRDAEIERALQELAGPCLPRGRLAAEHARDHSSTMAP